MNNNYYIKVIDITNNNILTKMVFDNTYTEEELIHITKYNNILDCTCKHLLIKIGTDKQENIIYPIN